MPVSEATTNPLKSSSASKSKSGSGSRFTSKLQHLTSDLHRLGVSVKTTLNPNHRHDEDHEKAVDAKIEKIRDGHRFRSFAGERDGNTVKWHVDGHGE